MIDSLRNSYDPLDIQSQQDFPCVDFVIEYSVHARPFVVHKSAIILIRDGPLFIKSITSQADAQFYVLPGNIVKKAEITECLRSEEVPR
jgi:hypothetical protein